MAVAVGTGDAGPHQERRQEKPADPHGQGRRQKDMLHAPETFDWILKAEMPSRIGAGFDLVAQFVEQAIRLPGFLVGDADMITIAAGVGQNRIPGPDVVAQ